LRTAAIGLILTTGEAVRFLVADHLIQPHLNPGISARLLELTPAPEAVLPEEQKPLPQTLESSYYDDTFYATRIFIGDPPDLAEVREPKIYNSLKTTVKFI